MPSSSLVTFSLGVGLALVPRLSHAEQKSTTLDTPRPWTGYIRTPGAARTTEPSSVTSSKIVYVKRCIAGCDVHYATVDDSRTGASSIAAQGAARTIGGFNQPIGVWNEMMACVKATFAPFDITVTDVKPADPTTPHFLNIVGGKPTDLHPSYTGAGGVAPFDCGEIPNAITYTFDVYGPDPLSLCWTVSQEVAHAFGLEHAFLVKDPMTYLSGDMPKRFRDTDSACGELEKWTSCECGGATQNTYRHIVGMFGPGAPTPPETMIMHPKDGRQTQPGFTAVVKALDDVRVEKVELYVDGALVSTATMPFGDSFDLPTTDFGAGAHTLEVKAIDVQGVASTATLSFTQGPPCTADSICTGADVCVSGVCVAGPDTPGGVGSACTSDTECLSHRCVDGGESLKRCVDECDVANADSCPDDFTCVAAGSGGVCWYTPSSGCCDVGGRRGGAGPQATLLLTLGLGVLLLRRRRARA